MPQTLPKKFEGVEVISSSMKITKAGDGLSEALHLAPIAYHHGDEVFVVLKGTIRQVNHRPFDKDDQRLVRQHTLETDAITIVAEDDVQAALNAAAELLADLRDQAAGREPLPGLKGAGKNDDDEDD